MTITVVIPTIPPRAKMLVRALESVRNQTRAPDDVIVQHDHDGLGAAECRNRALKLVDTDFVAFLDDDDELLPQHLQVLEDWQKDTDADLVYPWYEGINQNLWPWKPLGRPFDDELRDYICNVGNFIPITCLVRVSLLRAVGGFQSFTWSDPENPCEDWATWVAMLHGGAKFSHCPQITWTWHGHGGHTSGRPWTKRRDV